MSVVEWGLRVAGFAVCWAFRCGACGMVLSFCCFGISVLMFVWSVVLGFGDLVVVWMCYFSFVLDAIGWDLV